MPVVVEESGNIIRFFWYGCRVGHTPAVSQSTIGPLPDDVLLKYPNPIWTNPFDASGTHGLPWRRCAKHGIMSCLHHHDTWTCRLFA